MVGIRISGLEEIKKAANEAAAILEDYNERATNANLQDAVEMSVKRAPYKTGSLRRSISKRIVSNKGGKVVGEYGSNMPYARITELGGVIPAHTVEVRSRQVLYDSKSGQFFGKRANIPAQYRQARPFLFPVLVENIDRFLGRYKQAWESATQLIERRKR